MFPVYLSPPISQMIFSKTHCLLMINSVNSVLDFCFKGSLSNIYIGVDLVNFNIQSSGHEDSFDTTGEPESAFHPII